MFCSLHPAMSIYHEQRNVSYCMDSAITPDRHSASAEGVDASSVLVKKAKSGSGPVGLQAGRGRGQKCKCSTGEEPRERPTPKFIGH